MILPFINGVKRISQKYKDYSDEEAILLYQMGKVGSLSLLKSIPKSIHLHNLYYPLIPLTTKKIRIRNELGYQISIYVKKRIGTTLSRFAIRRRNKIKVITGVREPCARNLSLYFHGLPHYLTEYLDSKSGCYQEVEEGVDLLSDTFEKVLDHMQGIRWFEEEFKRFTGIDVYKYRFDKENGFTIIKEGRYEIFIYRAEDLSKLAIPLGEFIGKDICLNSANRAEEKWYSNLYQDFSKRYKYPSDLKNSLLDSKFYRHFYSKESG